MGFFELLLILVLGIGAIGGSVMLALAIRSIDMRLRNTEKTLSGESDKPALAWHEPAAHPLRDVRIALVIRQDSQYPLFATMLREMFLAEDASEVEMFNTIAEAEAWGPEILVSGEVVCNGYSEVYYSADLTCKTPHQMVTAIVEKPAQGDRPSNLGLELVEKLKADLTRLLLREERRKALRELGN